MTLRNEGIEAVEYSVLQNRTLCRKSKSLKMICLLNELFGTLPAIACNKSEAWFGTPKQSFSRL